MAIVETSHRYGHAHLTTESRLQPHQINLFGGKHIARSLSPKVNQSLFDSAGVPWRLDIFIAQDADQFLEAMRQTQFIGAAITMPYKVAFMPLFDILTDDCIALGAVSCAFVRRDSKGIQKCIGTNTDWVAIRDTLMKNHPNIANGTQSCPALVVGAGGAARAAIYALYKSFGASPIYVVNRFKSEVDDLTKALKGTLPGVVLKHIASLEEAQRQEMPRIVVGNVPDMPPSTPEERLAWQTCDFFLRHGTGDRVFLEMAYDPPRTNMLRVAEKYGWSILEGREVMVRAQVANQSLWLEKEPTEEAVGRALQVVGLSSPKL